MGGTAMFGQDLALVVQSPDVVKMDEKLTYDVYFKNQSPKAVDLPQHILGGSGVFFSHRLYNLSGEEIKIQFVPEYHLAPSASSRASYKLIPGQIVGACDELNTHKFFPGPGRYRLQFIWEGLIGTGEGEKVAKKYVVDKIITVQ
jgi:hypothetical protein